MHAVAQHVHPTFCNRRLRLFDALASSGLPACSGTMKNGHACMQRSQMCARMPKRLRLLAMRHPMKRWTSCIASWTL